MKGTYDGKFQILTNNEVAGQMEVTLGKTPTDIMTADLSKVQYGVFDYAFENIKLSITNTDNLYEYSQLEFN